MRPRCRWRIGLEQGLDPGLQPHRLLVSLIENRRVDGKLRQEHVADLGAIDGHMLSAYYVGIDPAIAAEIQGPAWARASVRQRIEFWQRLHERLAKLANRIDAEMQAKIMAAIHARIPMPTATEREAIPRWEIDEELEKWRQLGGWWAGLVTSAKVDIERCQQEIEEKHREIAVLQPIVNVVADDVSFLEKNISQGAESPQPEMAKVRQRISLAYGQILARKIGAKPKGESDEEPPP